MTLKTLKETAFKMIALAQSGFTQKLKIGILKDFFQTIISRVTSSQKILENTFIKIFKKKKPQNRKLKNIWKRLTYRDYNRDLWNSWNWTWIYYQQAILDSYGPKLFSMHYQGKPEFPEISRNSKVFQVSMHSTNTAIQQTYSSNKDKLN